MNPAAIARTWEEEAGLPLDSPAAATPPLLLLGYLALSVLLGVLSQFSIRLVGLMPVDEILLCGLLLHAVAWLAFTRRLPAGVPAPRLFGLLVGCQVIGLTSYVISDLWRESYPVDMLRGWLRMVFLLLNIGGFSLLFGASPRCFTWLQAGLVFSFVEAVLHGPLFGDYWKFGFAFPITILGLLAAPRWLGYWAALATCLGLGVLHSVLDFRSLGGICFFLAALLGLRLLAPLVRRGLFAGAAVLALCAMPWAFQRALGDAGDRATRSNVERSAMLQAAWEGFAKSPLIGQGSWFSRSTVMDEFLLIRTQNARLAGVGGYAEDDAEGVAIHSQILVALAEGGVFGATFFFAYGGLLLWGLWYCATGAPWHWSLPVRLFVLLVALWNLFMSPFSGSHRVEIAMATALLLLLWQERTALRRTSAAASL